MEAAQNAISIALPCPRGVNNALAPGPFSVHRRISNRFCVVAPALHFGFRFCILGSCKQILARLKIGGTVFMQCIAGVATFGDNCSFVPPCGPWLLEALVFATAVDVDMISSGYFGAGTIVGDEYSSCNHLLRFIMSPS